MKAEKARELARQNFLNEMELDNIFSTIRGEARQGRYEAYFSNLSFSSKDELRRLGYFITSTFHRNESNDTVAWYEVEVK